MESHTGAEYCTAVEYQARECENKVGLLLQVEWDKQEVPMVAHYAGCTVSHCT